MSWMHRIIKKAFPFSDEEWEYGHHLLTDEDDYQHDNFPEALLIIDVQPEFNASIHFDTRKFLHFLREADAAGTEIHVVIDMLNDSVPMLEALADQTYSKAYGGEPYGRFVIDKQSGEEVEISDMDYGELYFDPEAQMDIFRSSGHEFQHVDPDLIRLVNNLKGKQIMVIGGAQFECLRDITDWLDMNNVSYDLNMEFIYG